MGDCQGNLNLPLAGICISIITILIQIKIGSCANEGINPPSVDALLSSMQAIKNNTANKKHKLFDVDLAGIDLRVIPGLRDDDDFDNWEPPREIALDFPTYITGFDRCNRPIWVMELGSYNFGKYVKGGKAKQELLRKYFRYFAYTGLKSGSLRRTAEHPVLRGVIIFDYAGFKLETVTDRRVYQFLKKWISSYIPYVVTHIHTIVHINLNPVSEIFVNIQSNARGAFTRYLSRWVAEEFYSTNKYEWGPKLARIFPVDQLPEWYGGRKDFKPVYVLG